MSDAHEMSDIDQIKLSLPALPTYARVARLAITGLASRLDFTYDQIEDLRIAVGEMSSVMFDGTDARLTFTCSVSDEALRISTRRLPAGDVVELSELSHEILRAVVDGYEVPPDGAHIIVTKHRTP